MVETSYIKDILRNSNINYSTITLNMDRVQNIIVVLCIIVFCVLLWCLGDAVVRESWCQPCYT